MKDKTKRTVPLGVFVVVVVLVGTVTPTLAGILGPPTFSDVDEDHPFFAEIEWMAATGISEGYPNGTYRPGEPVTRQAMSAFMQRLYDLQEDTSWQSSPNVALTASATFAPVPSATTSVFVPAGTWANVSARFTAESSCIGPSGDWCSVQILYRVNGGAFQPMTPNVGSDFALDSAGEDSWESHAVERLAEVFGGGAGATVDVRVEYRVHTSATFALDDWTLVAETDLQPTSFVPS